MLTAITRGVSPSLGDCELEFLPRQQINIEKAVEQHRNYQQCLKRLGIRVVSLPHEVEFPDAVFVEDSAIVIDEVGIITTMGDDIRQKEVPSVAEALSQFRKLEFLRLPARLEGGDVMRIDRTLYVGCSSRTNQFGIEQLRNLLSPYGYEVKSLKVSGCLHFKTGCSYIGRNTLLANKSWVETPSIKGFEVIEIPSSEPFAANALLVVDTVLLPSAFPRTRDMLEEKGFRVQTIDISELLKAEAGLTCMSLIFESD